jgi:ribonuclease HII
MSLPTYEYEDAIKEAGYDLIAGVDEVGRGALASSVFAAAVIVPDKYMPNLLGKVNDSKKMSPRAREKMFDVIKRTCFVGCAEISNEYIDKVNILEATKLAMWFALESLDYDFVLVDGTVHLDYVDKRKQQQVIKGDSLSISIACASIVAKVTRDRLMLELHEEYPMYGWDRNKGYGTKEHIDAIRKYGPTKYHRMTFRKVKND